MSTSASGKVVDENGAGLQDLDVYLADVSQLRDEFPLGKKATTDANGHFSLTYADDLTVSNEPGKQIRQLRLRIQLGQHVLKEVLRPDTQAPITFDTITMKRKETTSTWATLGTGTESRLSRETAVRWLVDNEEAWGHTQKVIEHASTLDIMQLQIDVDEFNSMIESENPMIVLSFDSQPPQGALTAANRRAINLKDKRIERSILERVAAGKEVRIQIPRMKFDRHGLVAIGAVTGLTGILAISACVSGLLAVAVPLFILGGLLLIGIGFLIGVEYTKMARKFRRKQLARWFERAFAHLEANPWIDMPPLHRVRVAELQFRSNNLTHAKLVIDRDVEAVVLGSPFEQQYFDSQHAFDDPRRGGDAKKGPIHEVSVAVRGGAVGYLQEVFNSHWNIAEPTDAIPNPTVLDKPESLNPGEFSCSVQVVRTFDEMFTPSGGGEKGVLESYLRAIHFAKRFIYIENQYFYNAPITEALIDAVARGVKVILLLNPAPDMPLYLKWQQSALRRIEDSLKAKGITPADRLGVFSTWTHEAPTAGRPKPTLVDNYLHTKSALIDNIWATVGSANLDGASLDHIDYLRPLIDSELRNTEANIVVFEENATMVPAVDALRRRLWSEHLGLERSDAQLNDPRTPDDWLKFWRQQANIKKLGLENTITAVSPIRVLEFPPSRFEDSVSIADSYNEHATALAYLKRLFSPDEQASEVLMSQFDVIGKKGPPSHKFSYTAPSPTPSSVSPAPIAGPATALSDEPATT